MNFAISILVLIVLISLVGIIFAIFWNRQMKKQLEKVFAGRQELSKREFHEKYFQSRGVPFFIVKKIREILEEEIGTDFSRLQPDDRFSEFISSLDDFDIPIIMAIEDEFEILISDEESQAIETVDEMIVLVWKKIRQKENIQ
jgi:acyl carrier protein